MTAAPWPETIRRVLETERQEMHTCKPARVRSYDHEAQTAEIEIGVREVLAAGDDDQADTVQDFPILRDVPVAFPRGGGWYIHFPLSVGTTGLVYFTDTDPGEWRASPAGAPVDPGVATRHGLSGAVFVPGLHLRANPNPDVGSVEAGMRLGREGGVFIEILQDEIAVGGNAALALSADVKAHLISIAAALDTIATAAGTTSSYVYLTKIGANPIDTTITRGA